MKPLACQHRFCPPLVESHGFSRHDLLPEAAAEHGLSTATKVFAGGADNACGAIGSGILIGRADACAASAHPALFSPMRMAAEADFQGKVHFFNHGKQDAFYAMGVTLAAGYSLSWFKNTFAKGESFDELLEGIGELRRARTVCCSRLTS